MFAGYQIIRFFYEDDREYSKKCVIAIWGGLCPEAVGGRA